VALLAGDEVGYLSILDPALTDEDKAALKRQFHSLRAMKVADWQDRVMTATPDSGGLWAVDLIGSACFVSAPCPQGQALSTTKWMVKGDVATLAGWDPGRHPHPWQVDELVASAGGRTLVATTKAYEKDLARVVREADRAAAVADRFAKDKPPTRYVIYYAGPDQWNSWFRTKPPHWSAGVAVDVSSDRYEVVLNGADMTDEDMPLYLRHELGHAASLPGRVAGAEEAWWLIEGIAELAGFDSMQTRSHPGIAHADDALAKSPKGFELGEPVSADDADLVAGSYAVAFLAARCLSERFGEAKFVEFFHAVLHGGRKAAEAGQDIFGIAWTSLTSECADYVRSASR
jgi:hypothetical protein